MKGQSPHVVGRVRTCAGRPQWISSPSALTTRPQLRKLKLLNEEKVGCHISSCRGGFFSADPGPPEYCKFPRSLKSVSLSSLFGHEIGCTWALPMILREYFCLQPASCLGCRKAAQDSSELQTQNPAVGWGGKKQSHVCPTAKCCLDPDLNRGCCSHNE